MSDDLKDRVMTLEYQGHTWVLAEDYRELEAALEEAKAVAHGRGYQQGKAAGDAFGAAMREHVARLEAENKALREGRGNHLTEEDLSKLAWTIAVDMEIHAAIGTTTKKKAEDITATLSALSPTPVSVEEAAQIARDVVTMIDTMTDTAMRIGLAGTSDWDQLAGKVDIYEIQDRARALSEGEG